MRWSPPRSFGPGIAVLLLTGALAQPQASAASESVDFLREVRPILSSRCFKCHGPDEKARKAHLRLDLREEAIRPRSDSTPIVPGAPDQSEVVRRIFSTNEDELMPPPSAKQPLTDEEKEILRRWIEAGADYQPHWAFI